MKYFSRIAFIISLGIIFLPGLVRAEEDTATQEDLLSITARAEQVVSNGVPEGVKVFFSKNFQRVEAFRLQQVAISSQKRDEFEVKMKAAQEEQIQATDENRDEVLEGESMTLYSGAGERLTHGSSIALAAKYYLYKYYAMFVSSPIAFYLVGGFIIVYIIGKLFNRARSRGGE